MCFSFPQGAKSFPIAVVVSAFSFAIPAPSQSAIFGVDLRTNKIQKNFVCKFSVP